MAERLSFGEALGELINKYLDLEYRHDELIEAMEWHIETLKDEVMMEQTEAQKDG